jgi:large subunit ribosomal protein L17
MRHRKYTFKIGRDGAHRSAMLANMVCSLFECGEIRTTLTKAKEARRFAEKMITYGKKGDLHHRRLAIAKLRDKQAVKVLFDEISPRYLERDGGYTRIIRLGTRIGDAAEMCLLQLVEEEINGNGAPKKKQKEKAEEAVEVEAETVEEEPAEEKAAEESKEETSDEAAEKAEEADK